MSQHCITFTDAGTASTLWTEKLPLGELGTLRVRRASWIDFNEHTQEWEVRFEPHDDEPHFTDPSRDACIAWEHEQLNR